MLGKLSNSLRRSSKSKRLNTSSRASRKNTSSATTSPTKPRPFSSHGDGNSLLYPPPTNSRRRARSHEAQRRRPPSQEDDDYYYYSYPPRRTDTRRRSPSPPPHRRQPTLRDARRLRRRSTRDGSISADEDSRNHSPAYSPRYPADRTTPRRARDRERDGAVYPEGHSTRLNSVKHYPPDSYPHRPVNDRRRMSYDASYAMRPHPAHATHKTSSPPSPAGQRPPNLAQPDFPRSSPRSRSRDDTARRRQQPQHPADAGHSPPAKPAPATPPERPRQSGAERPARRSKPKPKPTPKPPTESSSDTKVSTEGDFWDQLPRALATFTGLKILTDHVDTAKEWADWLNDLQGAPEEIQALSAKATTTKDTITQIQRSLEARPDLVEGESGHLLKQQIEAAIKSTDASLEEMTKLLEEVGNDGTEGDGAVWKGLTDFYGSVRYKNTWEGKIKEAEATLQNELGTLSTLMVNIYSRALMKPAPSGATAGIPSLKPFTVNLNEASPLAGKQDKSSGEGTTGVKDIPIIHTSPPSPEHETAKEPSPSDKNETPQESAPAQKKPAGPPSPSEVAKEEAKIGTQDIPMPPPTSTPDEKEKPDQSKPTMEANASPNTQPQRPSSEQKDSPPAPPDSSPDGTHDNHQVALLDAAWTGDLAAASRELGHVSPMTRDLQGLTPLHLAVERDHLAIAMLLRDRHVDCNARDDNGRTPLHLAARFASAATVEFLLEKCRADPNTRNVDGRAPLHYAATVAVDGDEERRDVLRLLRDWGADPLVVDHKGRTPRDLAQLRDCWDAAATLRRAENAWEKRRSRGGSGGGSWMQRHGFKR